MRRFVVALLSATAMSVAGAQAADLPVKAPPIIPPPIFSWTGFYVGGNLGYGWGNGDPTLAPSPDAASQAFWNGAFAAGAAPSSFSLSPSGVIGGGQIGYNYQMTPVVFGIEADIQAADLYDSDSTTTSVAGFVNGSFATSQRLEWLGTLRGRIGYAWDRLLLYVTGGFAYGSVNYGLNFAFPATNDFHTITASETETGWTAGGGLEWAVWDNWSLKAEYLYVDLGDRSLTSTPSGRAANRATTLTETFKNQYSIFRVGANYRF